MAVYDGFFGAVLDEETGEYDRDYGPKDFTNYFAQIIGSGVCVHDNPDSFLVRLEDGKAVVSPGYLFIQGYWLKNDADYTIDLPGTGNYAIVAHLNLGARMIELEARSVAQAYPDSLVLAIVSPTSAEDTRYNTDICGVIDTAGALSQKVIWAVNYIDNEIESKLAAIEQDINAQAAKLDAKIAEVQAVADSITPPPIGTIKFSASQNVGSEWLRCDGSFVSERNYPELVEALGKLTPSADKFSLISDGEIGTAISNVVMYSGKLWVYSYNARTLYGVDPNVGTVVSIPVSSTNAYFNNFVTPSPAIPLILSIVPHINGTGARMFLAQVIGEGTTTSASPITGFETKFLLFSSEFTGFEENISAEMPVDSINRAISTSGSSYYYLPEFSQDYIPYIVSTISDGVEWYHCMCCDRYDTYGTRDTGGYLSWADGSNVANLSAKTIGSYSTSNIRRFQRFGFSPNNKGEAVGVWPYSDSNNKSYTVYSALSGLFSLAKTSTTIATENARTVALPLAIASAKAIVYDIQTTGFAVAGLTTALASYCKHDVPLPSAARIFFDPGCYLDAKDIYMIFVGTGILFFRDFNAEDVGYLDTTSVLGTITQFGQLLYSQSDNALYLVGQDSDNRVKVAKMVLNTLFDYANDGAWLPMIASDGVPAYIKAVEDKTETITDPVELSITVLQPAGYFGGYASVIFNGEVLIAGTYTRIVSKSGTFAVGFRANKTSPYSLHVKLNDATAVTGDSSNIVAGYEKTATFKVGDYVSGGITLQGTT